MFKQLCCFFTQRQVGKTINVMVAALLDGSGRHV